MDDLQKKVIRQRLRHNKWLREHYHYARSLGFTSAEATIVMNRSMDNIDLAARQYGKTAAKDVSCEGGE